MIVAAFTPLVSDYPTCAKTFATLRVYHDTADPQSVTAVLGITPTRSWRRGESHGATRVATHPTSAWCLCSEGAVASQDSLRHIEWLLAAIEPRHSGLRELRQQGHRTDISCYWLSESGHGGPTLTPDIMRQLAELELPVWFDVYFKGTDDETRAT